MTPVSPSEPSLVEQHVFAAVEEQIVGLDLLFSDFTPQRPTAQAPTTAEP
jgi:hypothetical protein